MGDLIDRARLAGEPTLIMPYHKPGAVLVPVGWYEEAAELLAATADGPAAAPEGSGRHERRSGPYHRQMWTMGHVSVLVMPATD
jgi:hypothetical protein